MSRMESDDGFDSAGIQENEICKLRGDCAVFKCIKSLIYEVMLDQVQHRHFDRDPY